MIEHSSPNTSGEGPAGRAGRLRGLSELAIALYAWGLVVALGLRAVTGDALPPLTAFSQLAHLFTLAAPLLLPLAWRLGRRRSVLALALGTLAALWFWLPWFAAPAPAREAGSRGSLRVLTWNLGYGIADTDQVAQTIRRVNPDFVALLEVKAWQADQLFDALAGEYPFHGRFEDGIFSKAFLSRVEPVRAEMSSPEGAPSYMTASVPLDGQPLTITCVHPSAKLAYAGRHWWGHDQLVQLAGQSAQSGGILLGDFNTTERSAVYRRIARTGLRDAFREVGAGPGFTFPVFGRYAGLPVPSLARIDLLWYAKGLECLSAEVTASAGSDHHGVVAVFSRR